MNAELITQAEDLRHVAQRLLRAGLVIDRTVLSPSHRRAAFALQCRDASGAQESAQKRTLIGFPYPTRVRPSSARQPHRSVGRGPSTTRRADRDHPSRSDHRRSGARHRRRSPDTSPFSHRPDADALDRHPSHASPT